jgi:simple sugar transport system ATP-binding protein
MLENSKGKATLLYSLEISELVAVCDRMAIMYKGKIVDIIDPKSTSMDKISRLMIGEVK